MSAVSDINYKDNFFEKQELTKIVGEPTYETLQQLLRELKANARTVHSNLGGGTFGHLALVISPASYALISPTPFIRPTHPGQLTIPAGSTQHAARTLKDQHDENLRVFHEVEGVDRALKQQLVAAIEPTYLMAIRDRTSNTIVRPVYEVLEFLFQTYGDIDPNTFSDKETEVKATIYDINTPIDTLFELIEDLVDFSGHANIPMTQQQSINIGYVIMWRTGVLVDDLKSWNNKPRIQKTWINFKTHFRKAVSDYKKLKGPTVNNSLFQNHANLINEIKDDLRTTITSEIRNLHPQPPSFEHTPSFYAPSHDDHVTTQLNHMANSISEYQQIIPHLTQQIQQLTQLVHSMQTTPAASIAPSDISTITTPSTVTRGSYIFPEKLSHYCWTHGLCNHKGSECRAPAEGHKNNATFENRLGGSNRNSHRAKKK